MAGNGGSAVGLEGVIAAETRLSHVDGDTGRLVLAGHDVEQLAGHATFEDTCALFWSGRLPTASDRAAIAIRLGAARLRAHHALPRLGAALELASAADALRAGIAQLEGEGGVEPTAFEVAGATAVVAAAWHRRRQRLEPIMPDAERGQAADYLRLLAGDAPGDEAARALDTYLVTVSDHGMNASTFAARVVASTGSDLVSAIVAAVGALKGPLHGGAPGPVLDMLDAVGEPERAAAWLEAELGSGRRIMGMGHRIYRVRDPRAAVLEAAVETLERSALATGRTRARLQLARAVEQAATTLLRARHPQRALCANVEFYTAVLLDALGIDRALFTATFAVGRVIGWAAHVAEQRTGGRLMRPASRYVGPMPSPSG
jgi:citrate synthase